MPPSMSENNSFLSLSINPILSSTAVVAPTSITIPSLSTTFNASSRTLLTNPLNHSRRQNTVSTTASDPTIIQRTGAVPKRIMPMRSESSPQIFSNDPTTTLSLKKRKKASWMNHKLKTIPR